MTTCSDYKNTGVGKCPLDFTAIRRIMFLPIIGSDGTENKLSASDALLKASWEGLCDADNQLDRLYVLPNAENVTPETTEPQAWASERGANYFLADGAITFTMLFPFVKLRLREALNSFRNKEIGILIADQSGNIAFNDKDGDGTMYPFPLDADAMLNSKPMFPTNAMPVHVDLTFQLDRSIDFSDFAMIKRDDLDFNPLSRVDLYGLDDVTITVSDVTTTGFKFAVEDVDGNPVEGIVSADLALYNTTTSAAIVITSVTEQTALTGAVGTYAVVMPAQSNDDVATLSLSLAGYSKETATVTVPGS